MNQGKRWGSKPSERSLLLFSQWCHAIAFENHHVPRASMVSSIVSLNSHPIIISNAYTETLENKDDDKGWVRKTDPARKQ